MTKYRKYTRDLPDNKLKTLKKRHEIHLKYNGFLTKNQKARILGLRIEKRTTDSEFWYRVKHSAKFSMFDLELLCKVADQDILQEIFEPLKKEDYLEMKKGNYNRTDLRSLIESIFSSHKPETSNRDDWRFKIAVEMITIGIGYLRNMPSFQSKLHNRMFEEVLDVVDENRDSSESGFSH